MECAITSSVRKVHDSGEQKYRVVVDFRKLNNLTIGDVFLMPDINIILDQLGNTRYFSCLDMASGYHQIPIQPEDRQKTDFSTEKAILVSQNVFWIKRSSGNFPKKYEPGAYSL